MGTFRDRDENARLLMTDQLQRAKWKGEDRGRGMGRGSVSGYTEQCGDQGTHTKGYLMGIKD